VFGNPGDLPIAGNWDGINSDSIGIYRPGQVVFPADEPSTTNFNWSLTDSLSGGVSTPVAFGSPGGLPIAGDWTTRYQSGIGLYNPSTGSVELKTDPSYSSGANIAYALGAGGDRPVAGRWSNAPFLPITTCPWNGTPMYSGTTITSCTYIYNGKNATDYATKWANNANPIFCRYRYPGIGQTCYVAQPGVDDPTDCTNFTSQVLLAGGLPMTVPLLPNPNGATHYSWYASIDRQNRIVGRSEGWRAAYLEGYPLYATALPNIRFSASPSTMSVMFPFIYDYRGPGSPSNFALPTIVANGVKLDNTYQIRQGDILYLNNVSNSSIERPHTAFVAGWGPYTVTWTEVLAVSHNQIFSTRNQAIAGNVLNPVIYIIDHGPAGEVVSGGTNPYSKPRPYYTLWWQAIFNDDKTRLNTNTTFGFIQIPTQMSFPVNRTPAPLVTPTGGFYLVTPQVQSTQLYLGITPTP
jgi:hypothetical protein